MTTNQPTPPNCPACGSADHTEIGAGVVQCPCGQAYSSRPYPTGGYEIGLSGAGDTVKTSDCFLQLGNPLWTEKSLRERREQLGSGLYRLNVPDPPPGVERKVYARAWHVAWFETRPWCGVSAAKKQPRRPWRDAGPPYRCEHCLADWQLVEVDMSHSPSWRAPLQQVYRVDVPTCDCCEQRGCKAPPIAR